MCAIKRVVVVFPLVPVTATIGIRAFTPGGKHVYIKSGLLKILNERETLAVLLHVPRTDSTRFTRRSFIISVTIRNLF